MRIDNDLHQDELADLLKIGRSTIGEYENGLCNPTEPVIIKLAEVFNVTTDYVLGLVPLDKEDPKIKQ